MALGPRCALLGRHGLGADVIGQAEPLVHAVAGATGLLTQALGLVGSVAVLLASASGRGRESQFSGEYVPGPLHAIAAGRAIAAQLTSDQLDAVLPPEPFPDGTEFIESMLKEPAAALFTQFFTEDHNSAPNNVATTRAELDRQLDLIRQTGTAFDRGDLHPAMACIAVPWPHPTLPAALACLGTPAEIAANEPLVLRCLVAAMRPAATPREVIAAAVESERPSRLASDR